MLRWVTLVVPTVAPSAMHAGLCQNLPDDQRHGRIGRRAGRRCGQRIYPRRYTFSGIRTEHVRSDEKADLQVRSESFRVTLTGRRLCAHLCLRLFEGPAPSVGYPCRDGPVYGLPVDSDGGEQFGGVTNVSDCW